MEGRGAGEPTLAGRRIVAQRKSLATQDPSSTQKPQRPDTGLPVIVLMATSPPNDASMYGPTESNRNETGFPAPTGAGR